MSSKQSKSSDVNRGAAEDQEENGMEIRDAPPADLLMEIQSFFKQGIQKHESSAFVVGNYKWRLTVYPNGREGKDEEDENISVYLSVVDTDSLQTGWEVNARCNILLHNQISDKYVCFRAGRVRRFDAKNPKWRISISKRTLAEPLKGYVVDDKCLFGAEVFICKRRHTVECLSLHGWKISDFSKLKGIWYSEEFCAGGFRWKVLLCPNGNKAGKDKSVSIYLVCVDAKSNKSFERVKADFSIRISNKLPQNHHCKTTSHWFTSEDPDWGYDDFIPIIYMRDPSKGFIINDCCILETKITVFKEVIDD